MCFTANSWATDNTDVLRISADRLSKSVLSVANRLSVLLLVLVLVFHVAAVTFGVFVVLHILVMVHFHVARITTTTIMFTFGVCLAFFLHVA